MAMSERGRAARQIFVERFGRTQIAPMNWNNNRCVRFRTRIGASQEMLLRIYCAWTAPQQGARHYEQRVAGTPNPPSYKWTANQDNVPPEPKRSLLQAAQTWAITNSSLAEGVPQPRPKIRLRPRI